MDGVSLTIPDGSVGKESACNAGDRGYMNLTLGQENSLEEEMTTHSNILAWKIPLAKEPSRLQSMQS